MLFIFFLIQYVSCTAVIRDKVNKCGSDACTIEHPVCAIRFNHHLKLECLHHFEIGANITRLHIWKHRRGHLKVWDITETLILNGLYGWKQINNINEFKWQQEIVFEKLNQNQIGAFIDTKLFPFMCGYRKGNSTQYALIALIEKLKKSMVGRDYSGVVLMDLSKVFDTLNHELMVAKLHAYGFDIS